MVLNWNHLYIDWKITPELYGYLYITCLLFDCMPKIDPSIIGINMYWPSNDKLPNVFIAQIQESVFVW